VYVDPVDDVDVYASQLERSVVNVLDSLAPLKSRTKRRGKRNNRWLSAAAVAAKRTRRQSERRWKTTMKEADRVAYRAACRAASIEINASRAAFYNSRLSDAAGDQQALWRVTKELLHSDDRPPDAGPHEARKLCDGFSTFFEQKMKNIADDVRIRLHSASGYFRRATGRLVPSSLDALQEVTVEEVTRLIKAMPPKASTMDYLPISLLKSSVEVMAPLISRLANLSFSSGVFPASLKNGRITPLIKKPGLDKSDMANYRPITNLSTLSKLLEKLVLSRIRPHIMSTGNFSEYQSAYRTGHSTETALLKVTNDIIRAACDQQTTALLALDLSAAFDTVDFDIMLQRISRDFGVCGGALSWLRSFITGRTQYVGVGAARSISVACLSGVPQGSVLGPLCFAMYISPISNIVAAHGLRYHQYADDTQLYMALRPGAGSTLVALSNCVADVNRWLLENGMLLNPGKTEAVLFGTRPQREKIDTASGIDVAGVIVPFSDSVKLLGVKLDATLSLDRHVTDVVRSCSYHTRALRHIRPSLNLDAAKMIAHGIVSARLDYCNSLLYGTSTGNMDRLQVAQNALARAVCCAPWSTSVTELRQSLHWLPIRQRVEYKLATITYKTNQTRIPTYMAALIDNYRPLRMLRSSDQLLLHQPFVRLALASKAFSVSAPTVWNSLSIECRSSTSLTTFKRLLKTELFTRAYGYMLPT